jgi:hypothetical protein
VRRSKPKNRSSSHAEGRKFGGRVSRFLALWRDYHDLLQVGSSPCPLFHLHPIFRVAYYLRRVHIFKSVLLDCRSLAHSVPSLLHLFYCCSVSLLLFFFAIGLIWGLIVPLVLVVLRVFVYCLILRCRTTWCQEPTNFLVA